MFKGITSNELKIIAIITMIVDHIGYYLYFTLDDQTYIVLRIIGRIAMPIFVYLIIQGYFNTKNLKKYILRLLLLAIITQLSINLIGVINKIYVPGYSVGVINGLNILFSFVLSLCIIYVLDNRLFKVENKMVNIILNIIIKIITILVGIVVIHYVSIDYNYIVPLIAIVYYIFEKIKRQTADKNSILICNILMLNSLLMIGLVKGYLNMFMFLAIPILAIYNGNIGKKSKKIRNMFYIIFPLQHIVLYSVGLLVFSIKQ